MGALSHVTVAFLLALLLGVAWSFRALAVARLKAQLHRPGAKRWLLPSEMTGSHRHLRGKRGRRAAGRPHSDREEAPVRMRLDRLSPDWGRRVLPVAP